MSCCTYLADADIRQPIKNKHVAEWLENARKATGEQIIIREYQFNYYHWFKKKTNWRYEICWPLLHGEYQVINFYRDGTDWSINMMVPAEMAIAYLIGVCARRTSDGKERGE